MSMFFNDESISEAYASMMQERAVNAEAKKLLRSFDIQRTNLMQQIGSLERLLVKHGISFEYIKEKRKIKVMYNTSEDDRDDKIDAYAIRNNKHEEREIEIKFDVAVDNVKEYLLEKSFKNNKIFVKEFKDDSTDFASLRRAEEFLEKNGYSYGPSDSPNPRAIFKGDVRISKWHNLSAEELKFRDGTMSGDTRHGPVTIEIKNFKSKRLTNKS